MLRSNGVVESAVKEMKEIVRVNVSANRILNHSSAMSGLQMFCNTSRSGTGESPAQILLGHDVQDSLPCKGAQLLPQHYERSAHRLVKKDKEVKEKIQLQPDALRYGLTHDLPLLRPKTPVPIQNPITKRWDRTGFIMGFGINNHEYVVKSGHKEMRRNLHFLKLIEVDAKPAICQPAQAPLLPARPVRSHLPVNPDWFKRPEPEFESEELRQSNKEHNRTPTVQFSDNTDRAPGSRLFESLQDRHARTQTGHQSAPTDSWRDPP